MKRSRKQSWLALLLAIPFAVAVVIYWWPPPELADLKVLARKGHWIEARRGLLRYLRAHPGDDRALMLLATVHRGTDDAAAALACLQQVPATSPRKPQALFEEGELHWEQKRAGHAEHCWLQAVQAELPSWPGPRQPPASSVVLLAWSRLADLYLLEDRTSEARDVLWKLFGSFAHTAPQAVDILIQISIMDVEAQHAQLGVDALEPCAASDPDDVQVRQALAEYYLRLGERSRAFELLSKLVQTAPRHPRVWESWLHYLQAVGERAALRTALEDWPLPAPEPSASLWWYRGLDHENHGASDEAADCYRQAAALAPRKLEIKARWAQALRLAGRGDEAEAVLEQVNRTRQHLAELSHFTGNLPQHPGNGLGAAPCLELQRICKALGWEQEATAWHDLALVRQGGE